jgi:conjugal transfer pilus assembly protein TraU
MVDVTRTPYCFVTLGGIQMNLGFGDQFTGTQSTNSTGGVKQTRRSVYHVHWYINPTMVLASIILDNACLDNQGFDIAYMSEIDPTWGDSELENLLEPDAFLFGNIIAQAACAADCVASSIGFGSNTLFWCAGCNGSLYPLNGDVQAHIGGVQASSLLVQRTAARLHRMGTQWVASGSQGLCGYYPQILMDKNNYKYSMSYPAPQGKGDGANNAANTAMASGMTQGWQGRQQPDCLLLPSLLAWTNAVSHLDAPPYCGVRVRRFHTLARTLVTSSIASAIAANRGVFK